MKIVRVYFTSGLSLLFVGIIWANVLEYAIDNTFVRIIMEIISALNIIPLYYLIGCMINKKYTGTIEKVTDVKKYLEFKWFKKEVVLYKGFYTINYNSQLMEKNLFFINKKKQVGDNIILVDYPFDINKKEIINCLTIIKKIIYVIGFILLSIMANILFRFVFQI